MFRHLSETKVLEDANYIKSQNIEVVRISGGKPVVVPSSEVDWSNVGADSGYRFRQRPGTQNSLGLVKFMLPNRYNVYLHDTPADSLFARDERGFSHGCIRLEKPFELARRLLRDQREWTEEKIKEAMYRGNESMVKLTHSIPVYITYLTVSVLPDGTVNFYKDIYGHDERKTTLPSFALLLCIPLPAADRSGFQIKARGLPYPFGLGSVFALPGEIIRIETLAQAVAPEFEVDVPSGTVRRVGRTEWEWKSPAEAGKHEVDISHPAYKDDVELRVFVMEPFSSVVNGMLNGYRIGRYPAKPLRNNPIYLSPKGFLKVTKDDADTRVAPHFKLKQFICKQQENYPHYLTLNEHLVVKIELILERLNQLGYKADTLYVMSGYRTPYYNKAIGNVTYSLHQWGRAADIFVDNDDNHVMDDSCVTKNRLKSAAVSRRFDYTSVV